MSTHWTCATPELLAGVERPKLDADADKDKDLWTALYAEAKAIIGTSTTQFDRSIRHTLVLKKYEALYAQKRKFAPLPLACHRLSDPDYVEWHAADRILEELFTDPKKGALFTLLTNHRCTRLVFQHDIPNQENKVEHAEVENLLPHTQAPSNPRATIKISAKTYVVACGSVGTAQVSCRLVPSRHCS